MGQGATSGRHQKSKVISGRSDLLRHGNKGRVTLKQKWVLIYSFFFLWFISERYTVLICTEDKNVECGDLLMVLCR